MLYDWLLAAHVTFAVIWVGGGVGLQITSARAQASKDAARMLTASRDAEWIGMRVFFPASILVLLTGIALVIEGQWGFSTPWVLIGIGGYVFSAVVGSAFLGPQSKQLGALLEERGLDDPEVQRRLDRIFLVSRIELVVLLLIVVDMTVKPG